MPPDSSSPVQRPSPHIVLDLDVVADRFRTWRAAMSEALPVPDIRYAVKANPEPRLVALLARLGCGFDVAGPGEVELCLRAGADPASLSYGNPVKKPADVADAYRRGVRLFTTDTVHDADALAAHAPGAAVLCRIHVDTPGAGTPFGDKFGCQEPDAVRLLRRCAARGLHPYGTVFHVGSQHPDPRAWHVGLAAASRVTEKLAAEGITLEAVDVGGGFPASYRDPAPPLEMFAAALRDGIREHFPTPPPTVLLEPGRSLVADAGVLHAEVVTVAERGPDARRWVYLDAGRYNGLAETENEAIAYRIRTPHDGGRSGPAVLAGPTCDGDDVLYRRTRYDLPLALAPGDPVEIDTAGAYTASYASVCFNGFAPIPTYCVGASAVGHPRAAEDSA